MSVPYYQAVLLGVIQGLTEFLPVSSDGHLAVAQALLGISEDNLALSVTLHLGTLLATVVFFRRQIRELIAQIGPFVASVAARDGRWKNSDLATILIATIPTGIIGLALKDPVERWTRSPWIVALGFLGTAAALTSTSRLRRGKREGLSMRRTLLLGVAQGLAVAPGLSRSASTIAVALHGGVKPERAFELSMLISLPAITGAVMLEAPKLLHGGQPIIVPLLGVVVAFFVGLFALKWLRSWVSQGKFPRFALWVVPMILLTLVTANSWPASP
ncbi:MAG TPA: undecaprenyl-diphosphate phosphatase [Polyangiaceae bacterium]|nr:undecaprenyl-diphosphate phosphatase [Polyangiaceae bacterium]